ncbi:hypothetical protein PTKIN_Ptkin16aG0501400 [Pterospermum kingtungense]
MELQHFSHQHPLVFNEEQSHESEVYCSGCGEVVSGPNFSCLECGFYLDKQCAEAPSEMNHPFHRNHSLSLLVSSPYPVGLVIWCDFCNKKCEKFVYHCSCGLDFHIKCALFSYIIAEKKVDHLQHIAYKDPSISPENLSQELKETKCFACWKPLADSPYLSPDSGFSLHKKCIELPLEINHLCHRQHFLSLQFNSGRLPCQICQETQPRGVGYCCSICKFVLHIECMSPSPIIEDHEHPFTRWLTQFSYTCNACGTLGNYVSYICSTCCLMVHNKCTSLPPLIKHAYHQHPLFHKYFVVDNESGTLECGMCHEEVNKKCGSYYCSHCNFVLHVNCALQKTAWYYKIESKEDYEKALVADTGDAPFFVIKDGENVINTEIKHFSHQHNLVLSEMVKDDDRYCDGCSMLITTSFYLCLQCHFSLHKTCAELPRKKLIWIHFHQLPLNLIPDFYFRCVFCQVQCSGFAYKCMENLCGQLFCVRCAEVSLIRTSQGHKHPLLYYYEYDGKYCNACGGSTDGISIYRCKGCDFNVHFSCTFLPQKARHKCDEHLLTLTYHEDSDYSKYHYCDICEEKRNPNIWFYYCEICDTSAHPTCVLGDFPFVKVGTSGFFNNEHPHSLVVVKKDYDYPECCKLCGKPCSDLAVECAKTRCNFIIHFKKCVW